MINRITEDVGNDAFIEITHFEKELPTLNVSQPKVDDKDNNNENKDSNVIFRYDEFYKFSQSDKTGKKTYDTLTVRIENADWYFDRKKWQAGVFSGYVDVVHLESLNQYGIYREDNTLVGCPNSLTLMMKSRNSQKDSVYIVYFCLFRILTARLLVLILKGRLF